MKTLLWIIGSLYLLLPMAIWYLLPRHKKACKIVAYIWVIICAIFSFLIFIRVIQAFR